MVFSDPSGIDIFGDSADMELSPGKQPSAASHPTAGRFSLFGAPSPSDTGAAPAPSSGSYLFAESAGAGNTNDFAFPQSSARGPGFFPQASVQASDTFFQSSDTFLKASDTLSSPATDAFSPPQDTFRTPLGAPPHKRQNQGSGQQARSGLAEPGTGLTSTPIKAAFDEDFTKEELGEHAAARASSAAPSPPAGAQSGGAAVLRELLADPGVNIQDFRLLNHIGLFKLHQCSVYRPFSQFSN